MADTCLLRQPVERTLFLSQCLIEPGYNHNRGTYLPHSKYIVDSKYILRMEHTKHVPVLATSLTDKALWLRLILLSRIDGDAPRA
jgi:hypothetical protein